jgi:predicted N-acetyltransferase YhbS
MTAAAYAPVAIRLARPEDADICGRICFEAFRDINRIHGFPVDIPTPEAGVGILSASFSEPRFYCIVAEVEGRIVGSSCMDERDAIAGIGPVTVSPSGQNKGVGRALMEANLQRVRERGFAGVRLVQAAFHGRSLALYSSLGFKVREPLSVMQGVPPRVPVAGASVRQARPEDLDAANRVCLQVHGVARSDELSDAITAGTARVVEREGRVTGYSTVMAFFGHAVAETTPDLIAFISTAEAYLGPGILIPNRNPPLFNWCLENGLRIVEPATLMSVGLYNEPAGAWLPSIMY